MSTGLTHKLEKANFWFLIVNPYSCNLGRAYNNVAKLILTKFLANLVVATLKNSSKRVLATGKMGSVSSLHAV